MKSFDHLPCVSLSVLQPSFRERGEVRILAKNILGGLKLFQLHQKTLATHVSMQGIERFWLAERLCCYKGVRERSNAQVNKSYF